MAIIHRALAARQRKRVLRPSLARKQGRFPVLTRIAREAAGWLLIAAIFYAPWDFGGTSASGIRHLNWMLGGVVGLCLVSLTISSGRRRFWSWWLFGISILLLIMGWGMALNAHGIFDADYRVFTSLSSPWAAGPGSADYALSLASVRRLSLLIGCVWAVAALVQNPRILLRLLWAVGLAGGSIALLGLLQKATGAEMIFWASREPGEPPVSTFFATFYYHGNAGAYLNLALPAVVGLAYRYTTRQANPAVRALWLTLLLIMIVAVLSDTSRMGQFIAVVMLPALIVLSAATIFRRIRKSEPRIIAIALVVGIFTLWAIVRVSHLDQSLGRWEDFRQSWSNDARWVVDRAAIAALPEAGWFGFGPGTFAAVFPHFNSDPRASGSWLFLHNDLLQTAMEWGWAGALLWGVFFFGGIVVAFLGLVNRRRARAWLARQRLAIVLSVIALIGVGLHALVDFPLQIYSIQLYTAVYLGICWGSICWGECERQAPLSNS